MKWEYKTIRVPAMDDWLLNEYALSVTARTGKEQGDEDKSLWTQKQWEEFSLIDPSPEVKKKAYDEIISKHTTFLNEQLGIRGQDGWELVSIWTSEPAAFFECSNRQWMTFKRSV